MRVRFLGAIGCVALMGMMIPVWKYLDQKEIEAQGKYELYERIHQEEEKKNEIVAKNNHIKEQQAEVEKELEPYEKLLDSLPEIQKEYIPQKELPMTDIQDAFFKAPYLLDVDGMLKTYEAKKKSVGLGTAVGNVSNFLGKMFFSVVADGTKEQAGAESVLRVQFTQYFYEQLEELEEQLQASLVEYRGIADYRKKLISWIDDDGLNLEGIQILQHIGGITDDEKIRMNQAKENAWNLLAKYEFLLNVYYDFNKDLMIQSSHNEKLLEWIVRMRERVSNLLVDCDRSRYGYTYEEKVEIIKTVTDKWMELVNACYENVDTEYTSPGEILYSSDNKYKVSYQWLNESPDEKIPRRVLPQYENDLAYKKHVTVYFSSDANSAHRAYYVKVNQNQYYYYMTDQGEEITYYDSGAQDPEALMNKIDLVYKYIVEKPERWESIAGSYL